MDIHFGLKETSTAGRQCKIKDQMHPEMVISVSTTKYKITPSKNTEKDFMTTSRALITKDNYSGPKLILLWKLLIQCTQIVIPILELVQFFNKEHHDSPHECSKCHSSTDFKFVHNFNQAVCLEIFVK